MNAFDKLEPFLNLSKRCNGTQGCYPDVFYKYYNGKNWVLLDKNDADTKGVLLDGTIFTFAAQEKTGVCGGNYGTSLPLENVCAIVYVDINGRKGPNTAGKDLYRLYLPNMAL